MKSVLLIIIFFLSINCLGQSDTLKDPRDGKVYKTVQIGNQIWMAENLAYSTPSSLNVLDSGIFCYKAELISCQTYGMLYLWEVAQNVCPIGWHLPRDSEFETLLEFYNNDKRSAYKALILGGSSGFNALLGGRLNEYFFVLIGKLGMFWSSTERSTYHAKGLVVNKVTAKSEMRIYDKSDALSVRCIKD